MDYNVKTFAFENPKSSLIGTAEVLLDGWLAVKGFKIFKSKDGKLFVKPPSKAIEKDGETKYYDDVQFIEEKAEGEYMGPRQAELFEAILTEFGQNKQQNSRASTAQAQTAESKATPAASTDTTKVQKKKPLWGAKV